MTQRTALVVDDSRSARFALRKHLESHAFKVETAESASAAYQWLTTQTPDMIFLDHVMPGEDGFAALRHLKADPHTAAIPVIICSSNEGSAFVAEARGQGAADVLQKPPTPEQLQRVLDQIESAIAIAHPPEPATAPVAPAATPATAPGKAEVELRATPAATESLRVQLDRLAEDSVQAAEALDARITAMESRMAAIERRLSTELAKLRKQQDGLLQQQSEQLDALRRQFEHELRTAHEQFAAELARAIRETRAQAVEEVREALIRALRS
ncbi:response regulator [Fontimonas sp. SYSU GA230001]|uniref:response regulator n=1 Tax=Fontimonas sp. SYSU GA230001 TaxID=3142450 RepID=UPI0032B4D3FD